MIEVEAKIRLEDVNDFVTKLQLLLAPFSSERYSKTDNYYKRDGSIIRTRETAGAPFTVTTKTKTIAGGVETNREIEFPLSFEATSAFKEMLEVIGYSKEYYKHKNGIAYSLGKVLIEVGTVTGSNMEAVDPLGSFAEFEIVLDDDATPSDITIAQKTIAGLIEALGYTEAIESRSWYSLITT